MINDIVFPKNNEEEFIKLADRLGFNSLILVYEYEGTKDYDVLIKKLSKKTKLKIDSGFILKDFKKNIKTDKITFFKSSSNSRWVAEKKKADVIFSLENQSREDFIHHRASGINQVMCELMKCNDIKLGFSFNMMINNKEKMSELLGRLIQNIFLARKYNIKIVIGSFATNPYEMRSFSDLCSLFSVLGMDNNELKSSFTHKH